MLVNVDRVHRWLPAIARKYRRTAVTASGLALVGGLVLAPATAASAAEAQVLDTPAQASILAHVSPHSAAASEADGEAGSTTGHRAGKPAGTPAGDGQRPAKPRPHQPTAPSTDELMPNGVPSADSQVAFTPTADQIANARTIIETGQHLKVPPRAWVIAVATSLQESKLTNLGDLGYLNDHDSLGLFQQRPSSGWGTPQQITDPTYAATAFYNGLVNVPGYQRMPLTYAAQAVQVSAYPEAYAKWEKMAADLVLATYGTGPYAQIATAQH